MTGMAAALFAADRGLSTVQAGMVGEINFASGLLDLMGVHPVHEKKWWEDPFAAITALKQDIPKHPYNLIKKEVIEKSFDSFTSFLETKGLFYHGYPDRNAKMITPAGTVKRTWRVPRSMWNCVNALENKLPTIIFDFHNLKGFSARQIEQTLKSQWPNIRSKRIKFPDTRGELYPEHMARSLEMPEIRNEFAKTVLKHITDEQAAGFPAIMGITRTGEVMSDLEKQLGIKIFEIPTMPPSITGLRLRTVFEENLPARGVKTLYQKIVLSARKNSSGDFEFDIGNKEKEVTVIAKGAILATGRFFGKGLAADRKKIRETIFDLPVIQPESRSRWHSNDLFDPKGHEINRAGLDVDNAFCPVDESGKPVFDNLHAAGSILAHQDWTRMKCGSGLSIATAYAAVDGFCRNMGI